jgi:hypothetical protein
MKRIFSIAALVLLISSLGFAQENQTEGKNRDKGTVTKQGYSNDTYGVNLKLPEGNWMVVEGKNALVDMNGKVAEHWNVKKDIRVVTAIEELDTRVIFIAERNVAALTYAFRSLKVVDDKNWFRKGPHYVYYQVMEAQNMVGERYKVQNYIIMKKENRNMKISFFIISPLNTYYENRFYIQEIYKNLEIK